MPSGRTRIRNWYLEDYQLLVSLQISPTHLYKHALLGQQIRHMQQIAPQADLPESELVPP